MSSVLWWVIEGTRGGAAGDLLHHGRFDFEVAAGVKERRAVREALWRA